ncbi:MAG: glycoside hydrolase family 5 protein [Treponema sp.]|nr:glycoside hydrolase family 5 protein [Treponema sp.]
MKLIKTSLISKMSSIALFSGALLFSGCKPATDKMPTQVITPYHEITTTLDSTAQEIVYDMGIGINLGNTMEAAGTWIDKSNGVKAYETAWGSPVVTAEMISGYAKAGFKTLRIPVAWTNLMSTDGKYTISSDYIDRVKQLVDWAIESGMYVIVNEHWDYGWIEDAADDAKKAETLKKYRTIWKQLAPAFKDYGVQLILESQNEELGSFNLYNDWAAQDEAWKAAKEKSYKLCTEINQIFVDVVRESGGNNVKRLLYISGYNTGIEKTCDKLFVMPEDPSNKMAISVHYYAPALYAILETDADWGKVATTWGTEEEIKYLEEQVQLMKKNFTDKGIPVIIGEYGCPRTYGVDSGETKIEYGETKIIYNRFRKKDTDKFLSTVCEKFYKAGMCPVLWDTQTDGTGTEGQPDFNPYMLYDRKTCAVVETELMKLLKNISESNR